MKLPKTSPASAGIFRRYAHAGGGADDPFNRDISALLPIARVVSMPSLHFLPRRQGSGSTAYSGIRF